MKKNLLALYFVLTVFSAFSQHQLKIITDLDHSFENYTVTIYDTANIEYAKYKFYTPDTAITYVFPDSVSPKSVFVMFSGRSGVTTYFYVSKKVLIDLDSASTTYNLQQLSAKEIRDYKQRMDHPTFKKTRTKKESGLFSSESPWMWCAGYTYQKSHLINLEVRKTAVDISGSHSDGLYGMTLLYAPYLLLGGDATVYPDLQFAPKAGIGIYFIVVNANISFIGYNSDFKKFSPAILPEVGLSAPFGFLHLDYGYNFYLESPGTFNSDNNRISLRASWFFNAKKVW